jgi:hypothetical protein
MEERVRKSTPQAPAVPLIRLGIACLLGLFMAVAPCRADAVPEGAPGPPAANAEAVPPPDAGRKPDGSQERPAASKAPAEQNAPPKQAGARKEDEEVQLGRRAAAMLEREYRLVRDPKQLARLEAIGRDIAAVCDEPDYRYTFKILDTDDINALSLPGGFTYVTKGMLTYVRSDHELAGVIAHEVAHAARHHVKDLIRREQNANRYVLLGILGAVLLGRAGTDTLGNMIFSAELLKTAYVNQYGEEAEMEADRAGVEYLIKARKYNPVGALTLIERLARDERRQAGPTPGIFRTHPPGTTRAKALEEYIRAQGFPINRLAVQDNLRPLARDITVGETQAAEVAIGDIVIYQTAAGTEHARAIAEHLGRLLQRDLQMRDVRVAPGGTAVTVAGETLLTVTEADAALQGKTPAEVASEAARALSRVLWRVHVDRVS